MKPNAGVKWLAAIVSAMMAVLMAEGAGRLVDGFVLGSLALRPRIETAAPAAPNRPDRRHVAAVRLADGVEPGWYELSPQREPLQPLTAEQQARLDRYPTDPQGAFFVWNPNYLTTQLCNGNRVGSLGILDDFFVFDPVEPGPYPIYRQLAHFGPPGTFFSNAFGWRGPELTLAKPPQTVRLAFVGASTTVSSFGASFSHPELIAHWLNLWGAQQRPAIRFEAINAGRMGIDSNSIAAIVRQEVVSLAPDMVIYYEGANQFSPGKALKLPATLPPSPRSTFPTRWQLEDYSVLARRALTASQLIRNGDGAETRKPDYGTVWPGDVNEQAPDVSRGNLPIDLDIVVRNFDAMRAELAASGSEFAVSSFIWMVYPGMVLDLRSHLNLYRYLNDSYWPASYAHLRRMADFQNRVFVRYAKLHGLEFLDVAKGFPQDPDLFNDAIHMSEDGLRLQAWHYLQILVPIVQARISSGRWPAASRPAALDPFLPKPRLMSREQLMAPCK